MKTTKNPHGNAISTWEDEGGAGDTGTPERARLDRAHDSDARGEHRYPDTHQTGVEQRARQERDDLKRGLAGRRHPRTSGAGRRP